MKKYIVLVLIFISFLSCRKNKDIIITTENEYPTEKYINTSIKGIIVGNRDLPIENATVETGNNILKTDYNGYFYFKDIKVNKEGATIKVSKENYTTVTKTYYPQLNSTTFLKIELKPGHGAIAINSNDKNKNFSSSIAFINITKNNFTKNGGTYAGDLMIKPFWTVYYKEDFYNKYIGHPVGYDKYFKLKGLKSYGIVGFDIKDKYNEKIELGEGNSTELKLIFEEGIEIPDNLPDKIPVWHFDYIKDKWLEKAEAVFDYENRYYTVDVNESGYWNFAMPIEISPVQFTLKSENNDLLPFVNTEISSIDNNYKLGLYSNSEGNISCFIPKNFESAIDIYMKNKKIEKKLSTGIKNISIPVKSKSIILTGIFYDCNDNLIQNGYVTLMYGTNSLFYYIKEGKLEKNIIIEEDEDEIQWFATNLDDKQNTAIHSSPVEDLIDLQDVYTCPEPFAILRYGDDRQLLELKSYEGPPVVAIVFGNDNISLELGFFSFQGTKDNYNFNNFSYTIIFEDKNNSRIFPLLDKEQKIEVTEFKQNGMMRGNIEGWAKHKDKSITLDSAYLKIDYSIYTD
jgi:hypothetical protein